MLTTLKRWVMSIFKIAQEIVPETTIHSDFYEYIQLWESMYKSNYEDLTVKLKNNNKRKMSALRAAKFLCSEISNLIFTEKVEIKLNNDKLNKYVNGVLKNNGYYINQSELIEYTFALGGGTNKCSRVNDKTVIDYVNALNFIPTKWTNTTITEGVTLTFSYKDDYQYILVERSSLDGSNAKIEYELYKRKKNRPEMKGVRVNLKEMYPDLVNPVIIENSKVPMFSYFKPNVGNNIDLNTPLGISIFANSIDVIKALDIAFDSFNREFVLGRKRITVPAYMLKTVKDPVTNTEYRYYDPTVDVYEGLNFDGAGDESFKIDDNTQELRVDEHIAAINAFLNILCIQIGVDAGFISFDATGGLKTATEIISENSKTFRFKVKQEQAFRKNIEELVEMIVTIGKMHGEIPTTEYELTITFDDSIIEDKKSEKMSDQLEVAQGLMALWEYRVKWYNEDKETAKAMAAELKAERTMEVV